MKEILVVYTGGTIGMQSSDEGLAPAADLPAMLQYALEQSSNQHAYVLRFISLSPLLDSSEIGPKEWFEIASLINAHVGQSSRVVVLHGTDTLAFTGSALSFLLMSLAVPLVLTGSQYPMGTPQGDALDNFIGALTCVPVAKVSLYFGGKTLPANRSIKWDAEGFEAFIAPSQVAAIDTNREMGIDCTRLAKTVRASNIVSYRVMPGESWGGIDAWLQAIPDAILLSVYGAGTMPKIDRQIEKKLLALTEAGTVLVAIGQCAKGSLNFDRYASGVLLNRLGVINGQDMTIEAAYSKLVVLFSLGYPKDEVALMMQQNLAGEITI